MKKFIVVLISILLLILDISFLPFLAIKGIYPSTLFVFAIAYSIINGKEEGVFIGVVSGILQDIYFTQAFGINSLVNMLICFTVGIIGESIWKNRRIIPVITMFFSTIIKLIVVFLIIRIIGIKASLFSNMYIAIYNSILMYLFYGLIYKFSNKDFERRKTNFRW